MTTAAGGKYAAEQGIAEEAALKKGMEAQVEEVRGKRRGGLCEGMTLEMRRKLAREPFEEKSEGRPDLSAW